MKFPHHRPRVSETKRREILEADLAVCQAANEHIKNCEACTEETLCSIGREHWQKFLEAKTRARFLLDEEDRTERPKE